MYKCDMYQILGYVSGTLQNYVPGRIGGKEC